MTLTGFEMVVVKVQKGRGRCYNLVQYPAPVLVEVQKSTAEVVVVYMK